MRQLRAKLKSRSGESLAEVLVALLVSALALLLLASMISSAVSIISDSRSKLKDYYEDASLADPVNNAGAEAGVVTVAFDGTALTSYNVVCTVCDDLGREDIISYVPSTSGGGSGG